MRRVSSIFLSIRAACTVLLVALGVFLPTSRTDAAAPQRVPAPTIEERVQKVRRLLSQGGSSESRSADEIAQAQWYNWPNWGNVAPQWPNWPNWSNWPNY